ncbi:MULTISPECIES: TetR/AcrR family transcriptional regulator [unclassified Bradyrhizobium]|uniref:TetR/AcrR family transcriptional regulator n=1 Tax=unclassified Bradyrhizobium TaxID=2631580 RepID=UPI001E47844F|nr:MULTISPECIES: TetR/AcrR family transcriptional regulator [unclassified Bradyrhizobium]
MRRIADTGLRLFLRNGYEATTLDAIAEAAGISRRTFFYYFKSKEDIILAWQGGLADAIGRAVLEQSTKQTPLEAVKNALVKLTASYEDVQARRQMMEIDRFIRANETLRAREATKYAQQEQAVFDALCTLWPQPKRQTALRMVAMVSIGAFRLAIDSWSQDEGRRSFAAYLRDRFANMKAEA